jgi:hypothetical protein
MNIKKKINLSFKALSEYLRQKSGICFESKNAFDF